MTFFTTINLSDIICDRTNEYMDCIGDIYYSERFKKLDKFVQHNHTSRLQHSINVSYYSYLWAKKLKLDYKSCARAGLLHDMYFYDWRKKSVLRGYHPLWHSLIACDNARKYFGINEIEEDAIKKHMWPCTIKPPTYKESYVVTMADKYCATFEFIYGFRYLLKVLKLKTE